MRYFQGGARQLPHSPHPISTTATKLYVSPRKQSKERKKCYYNNNQEIFAPIVLKTMTFVIHLRLFFSSVYLLSDGSNSKFSSLTNTILTLNLVKEKKRSFYF